MNVFFPGKGGKNRRRGKNENESEKRELVFKEDGQGEKNIQICYDFSVSRMERRICIHS